MNDNHFFITQLSLLRFLSQPFLSHSSEKTDRVGTGGHGLESDLKNAAWEYFCNKHFSILFQQKNFRSLIFIMTNLAIHSIIPSMNNQKKLICVKNKRTPPLGSNQLRFEPAAVTRLLIGSPHLLYSAKLWPNVCYPARQYLEYQLI